VNSERRGDRNDDERDPSTRQGWRSNTPASRENIASKVAEGPRRVTTDSSLDEQSAVTASPLEAAGAEMLQGDCAPAAFGEWASVAVRRKPRK
jgi:hypothetical protein